LPVPAVVVAVPTAVAPAAGVLVPTAVASAVLCLMSGGLLWYVVAFDARLRRWGWRG